MDVLTIGYWCCMQVFFQWPSHLELVNGNIHYRKRLVGCNSFSFQRWKWGRPIEKEKNWYSFRLQSFSTSELFGGNIATWQIQKQVKSTAVQQKMWWSPTLEKMFQEMLQNRSRKTLKDCKPIIKKQRQYRTKIDQYLTNSDVWTKIEPNIGLNYRCAAIIALCLMFAEHFTSKVGIQLHIL